MNSDIDLRLQQNKLKIEVNSLQTCLARLVLQISRLIGKDHHFQKQPHRLCQQLILFSNKLSLQRLQTVNLRQETTRLKSILESEQANSMVMKEQHFALLQKQRSQRQSCFQLQETIKELRSELQQARAQQKISIESLNFQEEEIEKLRLETKENYIEIERMRQEFSKLSSLTHQDRQVDELRQSNQRLSSEVGQLQLRVRLGEQSIEQLIQAENNSKLQIKELSSKIEQLLIECQAYQRQINQYRLRVKEVCQQKIINQQVKCKARVTHLHAELKELKLLTEQLKEALSHQIIISFSLLAQTVSASIQPLKNAKSKQSEYLAKSVKELNVQCSRLRNQLKQRKKLRNDESILRDKQNLFEANMLLNSDTDYVNKREKAQRCYRLLKQREAKLRDSYECATLRIYQLEQTLQMRKLQSEQEISHLSMGFTVKISSLDSDRTHLAKQIQLKDIEIDSLNSRLARQRTQVELLVHSVLQQLEILERRNKSERQSNRSQNRVKNRK